MIQETTHRFLDESGDPVFFGRGKRIIVGQEGVSLAFSLGMVRIDGDINVIRKDLKTMAQHISLDGYFADVPSVKKRISKGDFYFHAKDDIPEVREKMFRYIKECKLSYEAVVARKEPSRFVAKHNGDEAEFYADVLGHLIKSKLELGKKLVLNIAHRQNSTGNKTLQLALDKAAGHLMRRKAHAAVTSRVIFNVTTPIQEPILWIADYLGWAVQRVFERGETRHYDFIRDKIGQVCDLYDTGNYRGGMNFYGRNRPLSGGNKLGPPPL